MKQEELINLLNKMTIDEKIGQMVQVIDSEFFEEKEKIITGPENKQNSLRTKMLYKVGSILNTAGVKDVKKFKMNIYQKAD